MYIYRHAEEHLSRYFSSSNNKRGLILSGVVGCGKTTLVEHFLSTRPKTEYVVRLTCDDTILRSELGRDSKYLYQQLSSKTTGSIFLFIDEVQKSEAVFDAIKYAFDRLPMQFIVSGSNPDFLNTTAKMRLQRRADFYLMAPLALSEILYFKNQISFDYFKKFEALLFQEKLSEISQIFLTDDIKNEQDMYFKYGGFPRAYLNTQPIDKLIEIKLVVERGFESISKNNLNLMDQIIIEMANLHSQEFSYQGIFQRTGLRSREDINEHIDQLMNHGYLSKKKPLIVGQKRTSYLSNYSWADPGIVTYLMGGPPSSAQIGFRIEGYVFSRLEQYRQLRPVKSFIHYYKPFIIDRSDKLKFQPGEIDFILEYGKTMVPIEVKTQEDWSSIDTALIEKFIKQHKLNYGIVLYGGVPYWDLARKIYFWPYWAI